MKLPEIRRRKSKKLSQVEVLPINNSPPKSLETEKLLNSTNHTSNSHSITNLSSNPTSGRLTAHTTVCNSEELNNNSPYDPKHFFANDKKRIMITSNSTNTKYLKGVVKASPSSCEVKTSKFNKKVKFRDEIAGESLVEIKEVESYKAYNIESQINTDEACCCIIQ